MAAPSLPTSGPIAYVLSKLAGIEKDGANRWKARCPAHADQEPSLGVSEGRGGRVLLRCRSAGCKLTEVIAAAGLQMSDLFPDDGRAQRAAGATDDPGFAARLRAAAPDGGGPAAKKSREFVCAYDYTDENDALLYQSCRFKVPPPKNKDFSQRRPDGKGGWIWRLDDTRLVLYRLSDIIEAVAKEQTVYLVEGEKDADALAAFGYAATTNAMGAGKWRQEYTATLAGAEVVILPDNDDAGRSHAEQVAVDLTAAGCRVTVAPLPGLPAKGDVSDWLADERNDLDALERIVSQAPQWKLPHARERFWLDELLENEDVMRPPPPVVPRFAWAGRSSLIFAREKAGKSTLTGYLAAAVTNGNYAFGEPCQKGRVLVFALDEYEGDAARRLAAFGAAVPRQLAVVRRLLNDPAERAVEVRRHIADVQPLLVIVDTLFAYGRGRFTDANSAAQMDPIVAELSDIAHQMGVALIIVHHAKKAGGYRDSTAIGANVDVLIDFQVVERPGDDSLRSVRVTGRIPTVRAFECRYDGRNYLLVPSHDEPLDTRVVAYARANPGCSVNSIVGGVQARREDVGRAVMDLLSSGRLRNNGTAERPSLHVPAPSLALGRDTTPGDDFDAPDHDVAASRGRLTA